MTSNKTKLVIAAVLVVIGMIEFAMRRGSIGVACIIFALALLGMVLQDKSAGSIEPADEDHPADDPPS